MSLMMPDGKSWTTSLPTSKTNSSFPSPAPQPGQNGIPNDAIFRMYGGQQQPQQPAAPQTKQSGSMDFSAYAPGKAQPTQTPSLGTAYGQPQANPYANMQPGVYSPGGQFYGGNQSQGLADAMRQRDAFVQQSMQAMLPYQVANFTKQDFGQPQFDLQGMRNAASQMVQDGFYNPFTQYFQQQQQTMAPEFLNPYAPPSLYGNPYGMPFGNPYFMQPPPMFGGPMMPPTAPPMQADPYQEWLSSLPGYQPRDQWMTKQPQASPPPSQQAPVSKTTNDRPGMTYVPAEYRDGKLWSDAHYVNNAPPIPEYAPDWMTMPGKPMGDDYTGPIMPEWRRPAQPGFDYRLPKRDPRLEIESLRQQTLADLPYWSGRPDAPTGSVWDQPENAAVRERLLKETAEYDRDPYTTGGWLTAPPPQARPAPDPFPIKALPASPGQAQPIQPPSLGEPYGGKLVDIDKDGIDDRQQYGSPQEAMQAKKRADGNRSALEALSTILGPIGPRAFRR